MKTLVLFSNFLVTAVLITGCSRYQYSIVDSDLAKSDKGEIFVENDTVSVTYRFSGPSGPIRILIYNKLNTPLYLDWTQSAIVLNGQAISQWNEDVELRAVSEGTEIQLSDYISINSSEINGVLSRPQSRGFIPPNSSITSRPVRLGSKIIKLLPKKSKKSRLKIDGSYYGARSQFYTKQTSPIRFRSYLTLSTNPELSQVFKFDNEFWVKEISHTLAAPSVLDKHAPRYDRFYTGRTTAFGTAMMTIALCGPGSCC
jgi:hypothetical protein